MKGNVCVTTQTPTYTTHYQVERNGNITRLGGHASLHSLLKTPTPEKWVELGRSTS